MRLKVALLPVQPPLPSLTFLSIAEDQFALRQHEFVIYAYRFNAERLYCSPAAKLQDEASNQQ